MPLNTQKRTQATGSSFPAPEEVSDILVNCSTLFSNVSINLIIFSAVQYAKYMGRRVIAIDGGEEKQKLCKTLGADAWIDFTTSKDIVGDVKKATGGAGAHAAVVTTASVRRLFYYIYIFVSSHLQSISGIWIYTSY